MFENNIGIYKWTNKLNGKSYIGQSANLINRKRNFVKFTQPYSGMLINRAREKYKNINYWEYEVLEYCLEEELNEKEIYYINLYETNNPKTGYNLNEGGSEGNHHTKETIERIINTKSKPIVQIDVESGEVIKVWKSATEASKELNIHRRLISKCCLGERKTTGGYIWKFCDDNDFNKQRQKKKYTLIYQYDLDNEIINKWSSIEEASKNTNISYEAIYKCCSGRSFTSGGYIWKFMN